MYTSFSPTLHQMLSCTVNNIVGYIKSHKIKLMNRVFRKKCQRRSINYWTRGVKFLDLHVLKLKIIYVDVFRTHKLCETCYKVIAQANFFSLIYLIREWV